MAVYSRECILQTIERAKQYGALCNRINFGNILFVVINDECGYREIYNKLFERLHIQFVEYTIDEVRSENVSVRNEKYIAYSIKEKGVRVNISSVYGLNLSIIDGLQSNGLRLDPITNL